jgi:hypothetical protein
MTGNCPVVSKPYHNNVGTVDGTLYKLVPGSPRKGKPNSKETGFSLDHFLRQALTWEDG